MPGAVCVSLTGMDPFVSLFPLETGKQRFGLREEESSGTGLGRRCPGPPASLPQPLGFLPINSFPWSFFQALPLLVGIFLQNVTRHHLSPDRLGWKQFTVP